MYAARETQVFEGLLCLWIESLKKQEGQDVVKKKTSSNNSSGYDTQVLQSLSEVYLR